jgi:RNA polymerase sigma factor (sigma-70 family)
VQETSDDTKLIKSILAGNQQAYSALVKRHERYVFNLVLRIVQQRELAEELCQDVFVKAYRFLREFKGGSKFSTWLYRIAHNTCLTHLRIKKSPNVLLGDEQLLFYSDRRPGDQRSATDALDQKSRQKVIEKALMQLPAGDQEIISLYYQGEQSVLEIAMIMGLSASNIKIRLFRRRQKLKKQLAEMYKEIQS